MPPPGHGYEGPLRPFSTAAVPTMAALRERYAGIRVEFNLVPLGRSGVVTLSPNKSVAKLARDACVNYPGCQAARTGVAIREAAAREVLRVDASGFAQLAWELDEARASPVALCRWWLHKLAS